MSFFSPKTTNKTIKSKKKSGLLFYNPNKKRVFVFGLGTGLAAISIIILLHLYLPLAKAYLAFYFQPKLAHITIRPPKPTTLPQPTTRPPDLDDFYIFIPKINAQSKIYPNTPVDQKNDYEEVLKKGVAHLQGSGFPGQNRSIYLFAHSTNSSWNIVRYNAVFFLLNNLQEDDKIILFFNGQQYEYEVVLKKIVDPDQIEYLYYSDNEETLILQTCYPPGTTWKRLLVLAKPKN